VIDCMDQRLVNCYINDYFCENLIVQQDFLLSELPYYFIPKEGNLDSYKKYIQSLPQNDHPAAFGQHSNAEVSANKEDANYLLKQIASLEVEKMMENKNYMEGLDELKSLLKKIPECFDLNEVENKIEEKFEPDPYKNFLTQEVKQYNKLLLEVRTNLNKIYGVVEGLAIFPPDLEQIFLSILEQNVPQSWMNTYPSSTKLGAWVTDLCFRIRQIKSLVYEKTPTVFWLSGFIVPSCFFTAVLRIAAKRKSVTIDSLSWNISIPTLQDVENRPEEGVYISGVLLEGARWETYKNCLVDPLQLELICPMPIMHFKPVDVKIKIDCNMYRCPLYIQRPLFLMTVTIDSGQLSENTWVKRGVALLLSTLD